MFQENLRTIIEISGKTQKELAESVGVKQNTVSDWIKQGNSPKVEHLYRIGDFFNVSLDWLIADVGGVYRTEKDLPCLDTSFTDGFSELNDIEKSLVIERINTLLELKRAYKSNRPSIPDNSIEFDEYSHPHLSVPEADEPDETEYIDMKVYGQRASAGLGNYLTDDHTLYEICSFDREDVPRGADFGVRILGDSMEPMIKNGQIVWVREQVKIENGEIGIFLYEGEAYCKKLRIDRNMKSISLVSINKKYQPVVLTNSKAEQLRTVGKVLV